MTTFTRQYQPVNIQASVGSATPDFRVSTDGSIQLNGALGLPTAVSVSTLNVFATAAASHLNAAVKVSTSSLVVAAIASVSSLTVNAVATVSTLAITGGLVLTSAMVSAAASVGVGATTSHYIKFTQGANTFYIPCNVSAF